MLDLLRDIRIGVTRNKHEYKDLTYSISAPGGLPGLAGAGRGLATPRLVYVVMVWGCGDHPVEGGGMEWRTLIYDIYRWQGAVVTIQAGTWNDYVFMAGGCGDHPGRGGGHGRHGLGADAVAHVPPVG